MFDVDSVIDQVIGGKYLVKSVLGLGGMAAVFRAEALEDEEYVAVKVLRPDATAPIAAKRFLREAQLARRIRHPNVVQVRDVGFWEEDRLFIAMELVEGVSMERLLDAPLAIETWCGIALQVLDALAHVHARDILHRDIKPDNILVDRRPGGTVRTKLTDFGIASVLANDQVTRLTADGAFLGTPDYIAPEQVGGAALHTPALDIYPVGIMLYRLLSGDLPFQGTLLERLVSRIQDEPPPLTPRQDITLPPGLAEVVARMMAIRPEDRFGSAADAKAALTPFAAEPRIDASVWRSLLRSSPDDAPAAGAGSADTHLLEETRDPIVAPSVDALWGRDSERDALDAMAMEAERGSPRIVILKGEPGIGKTTLMTEVAIGLAEEGRFSVLQTGYQDAAGAEVGIRGAFERMLGTRGKSFDAIEASAREFLRRLGVEDEEEVREFLDYLCPQCRSARSQGNVRDQWFALTVRLFRLMAQQRPVLLALDDLPKGGPDAAAFLEYVLFEVSYEPFPLLVMTTMPPTGTEEILGGALASEGDPASRVRTSMRIEPLTEAVIQRGVRKDFGLDEETARRIASRAGGNPLFARILADAVLHGALERSVGTEDVPRRGSLLPLQLRRVLEHSLNERLDRSPRGDQLKDLLLRIAVLGDRAAIDLLELVTESTAEELADDINRLIEMEILAPMRSAEIVGFTHGLLREALIEGMDAPTLRRLHAESANARIVYAGAQVVSEAGAIGDHLAAAGTAEKAVRWWLDAAAYERAAGDVSQGVAYARKALERLDADDPRRPDCARDLGVLLRDVGELKEAISVLEPLTKHTSAHVALEIGEILAECYQDLGQGDVWFELLTELEGRVDEADESGRAAFLRSKAFWLNYQGQHEKARRVAAEALDISGHGPEAQRAAIRLAWACKFTGDLDAARAAAARALREVGSSRELLGEALRISIFVSPTDEPAQLVSRARSALDLQRRTGRAGRVVRAISDYATTLLVTGDQRGALESFAEAERLALELAMAQQLVHIRLFSFVARLELGEHEGIPTQIDEVRQELVRSGARGFIPLLDLCEACAHAAAGRVVQALLILQRLGRLDVSPFSAEFGRIIAGLGVDLGQAAIALEAGPRMRAPVREALRAARRYLEERGLDSEAAECTSLRSRLGDELAKLG